MPVESITSQENVARISPKDVTAALKSCVSFCSSLQNINGAWHSRYYGPMFLTPIYILTMALSAKKFSESRRKGLIHHILESRSDDGSIGLFYRATQGRLYTSILNYIALRVLGYEKEAPELRKLLQWINTHGGPLNSSIWCKVTLSWFGLYHKSGIPKVLPEILLLPRWLPFHPANYWTFSRQVYLGMAYLYKGNALPPLDLLDELREELYDGKWLEINFSKHTFNTGPTDIIVPVSKFAKMICYFLNWIDPIIPPFVTKAGRKKVLYVIRQQLKNTDNIYLGPLTFACNCLVLLAEDGSIPDPVWKRYEEYIYDSGHEAAMMGYHSTKGWDTAFYLQGIKEVPPDLVLPSMAERAEAS